MNAPRDWTLLCLSCGAVVALSQLFSLYTSVPCTWVPGYLGTWVPGYLGTWENTYVFVCDNTYTFCVRVIANRKKKYTCYRNLPLIRFMMFWGAIFFVLVPRGKGESYFFDKYFFAQNDMNRINIWFGLLLDRINYGTLEIFSGHLVLNSVHNISNRGK